VRPRGAAGPAYLERAGHIGSLADLKRHLLIHLDEPFRPRPNWVDYFHAMGEKLRPEVTGLQLNDYALVISAALEGQGIALGWRHQTDHLVSRGLLAHPLDRTWTTGLAFHVVWPHGATLSPSAATVRHWLATNPPIPAPAWPARTAA